MYKNLRKHDCLPELLDLILVELLVAVVVDLVHDLLGILSPHAELLHDILNGVLFGLPLRAGERRYQ